MYSSSSPVKTHPVAAVQMVSPTEASVVSQHQYSVLQSVMLCLLYTAGETDAGLPSSAMRWNVVSVGVVGSILALSVLSISGLAVYYRHKHKKRKRT